MFVLFGLLVNFNVMTFKNHQSILFTSKESRQINRMNDGDNKRPNQTSTKPMNQKTKQKIANVPVSTQCVN